MSVKHGGERLLPFTDAVVAIAMTLLILPLVEIATSVPRVGGFASTRDLLPSLLDSIAPFIGFAISFFVIARLWWAHHAIFERVHEFTTAMVVVDVLWLFTIVLLPWTTVYSTDFGADRVAAVLYVGTMTASSAMQTVLARLIVRQEQTPDRVSLERYWGNLTTLVAFAVALVLCTAFPQTHYTPLILLAFTGLVDKRVHRRLTARAASGTPE